MMRLKGSVRLLLLMLAALAALCLAFAPSVAAQCAMCRAALSAGSSGASLAKSFNTAVLVLLAPPVTIFCSIFIVAYKHRKPQGDAMPEDEERRDEE